VDQYNALRGRQLSPGSAGGGGLPEAKQLGAIRAGARLVVATPGRLEDYLGRKLINFVHCACSSSMRPIACWTWDSLPAIRRIAAVLPKQRRRCAFPRHSKLRSPSRERLHEKPRASAFGSVLSPRRTCAFRRLKFRGSQTSGTASLLAKETGRCLVFARTKRGTEKLANNLNREECRRDDPWRPGRNPSERRRSPDFNRDAYRVLVATDLASRGIHVQDIAHVINYDLRRLRRISSTALAAPGAPAKWRSFNALRAGPADRAAATGAYARHPDGEDASR